MGRGSTGTNLQGRREEVGGEEEGEKEGRETGREERFVILVKRLKKIAVEDPFF